jgi:hypothetical protein
MPEDHTLDPVCLMHGQRKSQHLCLYCSICYESLTLDQCYQDSDGQRWDICKPCAAREQEVS